MGSYDRVIKTIMEAGNILSKDFGRVSAVKFKSHSGVDAVTKLDTQAEEFIAKKLSIHYPETGFVGEESGKRDNSDRFWLVDPIDGTGHFIRGNPFCTTMIALVDDGEIIFSAIHNFITGELFTAERGKGAKLNGELIHVSNRSLKEAYISVESNLSHKENIKPFVSLSKKCVMFHSITCGYEYGLIASGKLEGRICIDPYGKDWDFAAGSLLVSEAGGIVRNIGKNSYNYRNHDFIATNKTIYDELTKGSVSLFSV